MLLVCDRLNIYLFGAIGTIVSKYESYSELVFLFSVSCIVSYCVL